MQNNKPKPSKNKPIKKQKPHPSYKKHPKTSKPHFQDIQLLDLISSSQPQHPIQQDPPIQTQQVNLNNQQTQKPMQDQQPNNNKNVVSKVIVISNQERLYVVEIDRYYKVKIGKDIKKYVISSCIDEEKIEINGRQVNEYYPQNSFIFKITRSQIITKNNQFLNKISKQQSLLIKSKDLGINFKKQTLLRANCQIFLEIAAAPWIDLPVCADNNDSLMILGTKNSGKSMLAQYLSNLKGDNCAFLDCDLGRNSTLQGCVSISCSIQTTKKIWIGQLTPLNNLQTYLRAISYLYSFYRQNWYTKKLIVNTMGYTTGLGQLLIYQIYQIIKPKQIIVLQSASNGYNSLNSIIRNIQNASYLQKLYINKSPQNLQFSSSSQIFYYENMHASSKKGISRFQKNFEEKHNKIVNICDLLQIIHDSSSIFNRTKKILNFNNRDKMDIYQQGKHQKSQIQGQQMVCYRKLSKQESVDMRLIILGRFVPSHSQLLQNNIGIGSQNQMMIRQKQGSVQNGLFEVMELGFAFDNRIYSKMEHGEGIVGIVNEGMDFQKGFYHLNQKQLLEYQLKNGRLNYLLVSQKCLGSKGVRNNPSKTT